MNQAGTKTQDPTPNKGVQYPMSNKEYPRMKDRSAAVAIPALWIANFFLVI